MNRDGGHRKRLRVPSAATGTTISPSAAAFEVIMFKPSLATIALFAVSQTALAQLPPPGAGGQLQQIPPPPAPTKAAPNIRFERRRRRRSPRCRPAIRVNRLRVSGNISFTGKPPGRSLRRDAGQPISPCRSFATRPRAIAAYYNARGYFLAQAYVPAQDIADGNVTIAVVEGRYGRTESATGRTFRAGCRGRILGGLDSGDPRRPRAARAAPPASFRRSRRRA